MSISRDISTESTEPTEPTGTSYVSWQAPEVDDSLSSRPADVQTVREQARQQGYDAGVAAGTHEVTQRVEYLDSVLNVLARPFDDLDEIVSRELLTLVTALVGQLVRRELRLDPTHLIGVVRGALAALPATARNVRVLLNPEDAAVIRDQLTVQDGDRSWSLEIDPLLARGDCRLATDTTEIDERLETRLARIISAMLHEERQADG